MAERYAPTAFGLHVCGSDDAAYEFVTVANFPARSAREARAMFEQAKAECAAIEGEPCELVVDLCLGHNEIPEDFPITRQMLDRLTARFGRNEAAQGAAMMTGEL